ncbi:ANTAR domain-containing protein [Streptomyces sp. ODS28]|uniref:ANTAR domain-containing protein n=1 Tax=Streptomyces sp. ODS28 TaxID=3136688 RepID=UPI0031F01170
MVGDTVRGLLDTLRHSDEGDLAPQWAAQVAHALGLDGVAVSVSVDGPELVCFSDEASARLENLQFTLGEGPGIEAARSGVMFLLADVRATAEARWSGFLSEVGKLPVRAVFAFPLRWGALRVGVFTGYRSEAGLLGQGHTEEALVLCDALTEFVLRLRLPHPDGSGSPGDGPGTMDLHRAEVHQATGMLSARLEVPLATAMSRLRAEAFALGLDITEVARAVVRRELTLTADAPPRGGPDDGSSPRGQT